MPNADRATFAEPTFISVDLRGIDRHQGFCDDATVPTKYPPLDRGPVDGDETLIEQLTDGIDMWCELAYDLLEPALAERSDGRLEFLVEAGGSSRGRRALDPEAVRRRAVKFLQGQPVELLRKVVNRRDAPTFVQAPATQFLHTWSDLLWSQLSEELRLNRSRVAHPDRNGPGTLTIGQYHARPQRSVVHLRTRERTAEWNDTESAALDALREQSGQGLTADVQSRHDRPDLSAEREWSVLPELITLWLPVGAHCVYYRCALPTTGVMIRGMLYSEGTRGSRPLQGTKQKARFLVSARRVVVAVSLGEIDVLVPGRPPIARTPLWTRSSDLLQAFRRLSASAMQAFEYPQLSSMPSSDREKAVHSLDVEAGRATKQILFTLEQVLEPVHPGAAATFRVLLDKYIAGDRGASGTENHDRGVE